MHNYKYLDFNYLKCCISDAICHDFIAIHGLSIHKLLNEYIAS